MARKQGADPQGGPLAIAARLHGAPRLLLGHAERPLERKIAAVIAYLGSSGPSSRSALAALLWPDAPPEGARNNLRQALFKLKKAARREVVVGTDTLALADGLRCHLGDAAAGETLLAACAYDDCPEFRDWLGRERERLAAETLTALAESAARLERDGDFAGALDAALRGLRIGPLDESFHRRVMRLHYLRGDRAAALAAFASCTRLLRDELGAEPDPETRALAQGIAEGREARSPRPDASMPVTLLRPPRLIGRDAELDAMQAAWTGQRAFLLLGDAGMGKSRLIAEFTAHREGTVVSSARPGDQGIAYASLARLLRVLLEPRQALAADASRAQLARLLPELGEGEAARDAAQPRILQAALAALVRRGAAQDVRAIVLDDLHFADAASLEMVNALAGEDLGVSWGFAQRPAEGVAQARGLREALSDAWRLDAVKLAPFDEVRMAEFIESLHLPGVHAERLAPQLVRATGGNPLFALETLKSAALSGAMGGEAEGSGLPRPASVGALIERRLAQLTPHALALARVAAIAGVDFDARAASRVLDEKPLALADAWRELEDANVLHGAAFAHDLIHEATLRGIPAPIAKHAHGVIAAHLEETRGAPERIAEHWIEAGEAASAIPFLKAAAVKAEKAARFGEARALLERAIEIASAAADGPATFELRFLLVELLKDISGQEDILSQIDAMRADASTADQRFRLARAEVQARYYLGQDIEGAMRAGTDLLEDEELCARASPERIAELRYALGDSLIGHRMPREALGYLEPVEPVFRSHADPQFRGWFYSDLGRALVLLDRPREGEAHLEEALKMARIVGRNRMICGVLMVMAQAASVAGKLGEPVERIQEAQLLIADMGDSHLVRLCHCLAAEYLLNQGRYREALEMALRAEEAKGQLAPAWRARSAAVQEVAWAHLGESSRSRRYRAIAERENLAGSLRVMVLVYRIEALLTLGEPAGALMEEYESSIADQPDSARWRLEFWRARSGNAPSSLEDFIGIARRARDAGLNGHAIEAHVAAARLARESDPPLALEQCHAALELQRRYSMPGAYRAATWLECHQALRDADPALAAEALREGVAWVRTVARYQVPEELRETFLANRVNRALLETQRAFASR